MVKKREKQRMRRARGQERPETTESVRRPETEAQDPEELWIAWCPSDDGGCGWYRMIDPACEIDPAFLARCEDPNQALEAPRSKRLATCLPGVSEAQVASCDVVVFQRVYDPQTLDRMVRLKRRGLLVVYDLDDAIWALGPECLSPVYPVFMQSDRMEYLTLCMQEADLVTVSTEALAEEVRRWCQHVEVLPNRVKLDRWDKISSVRRFGRMGKEVVIGWAGSATHERDMRMILPELQAIDREFAGQLLWRFIGDHKSVWPWCEALTQNETDVHPWTRFEDYPGLLRALDLDIGIAPLWPHIFNLSKSPVKAFEYSLAGAAVVASDYGPYSILRDGTDALLCRTPADWAAALRALILDGERRKAMSSSLASRVRSDFAIEGAGRRWVDVYWKHLLRVREQEERWLFHSRRWASPARPTTVERIGMVERRN